MMAPKLKNSEADNLHIPKRSHKMLSLRKKVEVFNLKEKKKSYSEVAKIYNNFIIEYCYNCSIIVSFLPCLIYKLKFIIGVHVYICTRKKYGVCRVWGYPWF